MKCIGNYTCPWNCIFICFGFICMSVPECAYVCVCLSVCVSCRGLLLYVRGELGGVSSPFHQWVPRLELCPSSLEADRPTHWAILLAPVSLMINDLHHFFLMVVDHLYIFKEVYPTPLPCTYILLFLLLETASGYIAQAVLILVLFLPPLPKRCVYRHVRPHTPTCILIGAAVVVMQL